MTSLEKEKDLNASYTKFSELLSSSLKLGDPECNLYVVQIEVFR